MKNRRSRSISYFLRCRMRLRMRRFLRPTLRRPFPRRRLAIRAPGRFDPGDEGTLRFPSVLAVRENCNPTRSRRIAQEEGGSPRPDLSRVVDPDRRPRSESSRRRPSCSGPIGSDSRFNKRDRGHPFSGTRRGVDLFQHPSVCSLTPVIGTVQILMPQSRGDITTHDVSMPVKGPATEGTT
jgi:hypothetical protein